MYRRGKWCPASAGPPHRPDTCSSPRWRCPRRCTRAWIKVYISGVLRLAIAQLRPRKGAYDENLCRLGALFREVGGWAEPPDLVVGPETALTGYFLEGGVRDLAVSADRLFQDLSLQHQDAKAPPCDVALGRSERVEDVGQGKSRGGPL